PCGSLHKARSKRPTLARGKSPSSPENRAASQSLRVPAQGQDRRAAGVTTHGQYPACGQTRATTPAQLASLAYNFLGERLANGVATCPQCSQARADPKR